MIITLTTDFGLSDPFVGIMKGVILGIAPTAQIVDISHDVDSYDVLEAAVLIERTYQYFPPGTVHVLVVDPGVGSGRRPIAAAAHGHFFVGPDNGILGRIGASVHHITNHALFLKPVSQTFHGRDIFAPVAAHLARGVPLESVGPRVHDFMTKSVPEPTVVGDKIIGTVLRIDKFGNVITNLQRTHLHDPFTIRIAGRPVTRLCSSFSEGDRGELFAVEGSTGYIELALNQESAADRLNVQRGAEIEVESGTVNH
jgi:S-adenosyl-L-methionine hydrolase (adenosine-forming)